MWFISHRGNVAGKNPDLENEPSYLIQATHVSTYVELDVWLIGNQFYTGHDFPQYPVDLEFLKNPKFICHAKNLEALICLIANRLHCFWHENDSYVLTSYGAVWKYPEMYWGGKVACICADKKPDWIK